jgi:hypothetical protein
MKADWGQVLLPEKGKKAGPDPTVCRLQKARWKIKRIKD